MSDASYIQGLIERARKAMDEVKDYTQEQADAMVFAAAKAVYDNAEVLAKQAVEESGLGRVDHKIGKNQITPFAVWEHLKDKKSVGVIDEDKEKGIIYVAHPAGVIGAISPTTNPNVTPLVNFMQAAKGLNAVIVSPHPRAEHTTNYTCELIREAIAKLGAPKDLLICIEGATVEKSAELMKQCDLIVATGGPALTIAAYSSGTPALGVGPGNPSTILDKGFDLAEAAKIMLESAGFDNGVLCDGSNSMLYPKEEEAELFRELNKVGFAIYTNEKDVEAFRKGIFPDGAHMDKDLVGKDAAVILKACGFDAPKGVEAIGFKVNKFGAGEILTKEILGPTLALKSYDTFEEAVEMAARNLKENGGIGHGTGILSHNKDHIMYAGTHMPVSRFLINQPTSDGWGPVTNGLIATASEGCGTWGNNSLSENVDYIDQLNITRIVRKLDTKDLPDMAEVFR